MTGLAGLLIGPAPAGVYRLRDDASVDAAVAVAEAAGWRVATASTDGVTERRAVFAALKDALGFPGWFGHNLDALVDCLRDVDTEPGTLLVWTGSAAFAAAAPDRFRAILAVLRDRALDPDAPARFLTVVA